MAGRFRVQAAAYPEVEVTELVGHGEPLPLTGMASVHDNHRQVLLTRGADLCLHTGHVLR